MNFDRSEEKGRFAQRWWESDKFKTVQTMDKGEKPLVPFFAPKIYPLEPLDKPFDETELESRFVSAFARILAEHRQLKVYMESCVKCGACVNACHTYQGTGELRNIPVMRADLLRRYYKKYFTTQGAILGPIVGAEKVTFEGLKEMYYYFYQCSQCRRCSYYCPMGIDTAEITRYGREILVQCGFVSQFHWSVLTSMWKLGNHMIISKPGLMDTVEFLEEELKEETGVDIKIPVDDWDAELLYNPSSADFFAYPDTMMGVAKVMHAAGIKWTISSNIIETGNFGLFLHENTMRMLNKLLIDQSFKMKDCKEIVLGECAHGWRTWKMMTKAVNGEWVDKKYHYIHLVHKLIELIDSGRIKIDPSRYEGMKVTLHDSCNNSRGAGIIEEPRYVLSKILPDGVFTEMTPNREMNWCCGGGTAILWDDPESIKLRVKLSKNKAEQYMSVNPDIAVVICSIGKAHNSFIVHEGYKKELDHVKIKGLVDLVGDAIVDFPFPAGKYAKS
ncbi:(Fe-S)-binding protein [Thermodesulfobium sp. 4217-1]|uniref:(Fe-S)-binding protein n=1 Tax=Thermodesulfobium sp. 4217-1 TaxID=3120013 RepID=UPI0032219C43